jgi:hypothetical protein
VALALATALAAGGCHWLFAWAFAPRHPKQTVKAEYVLKADRLVIVPYAGTEILFNDPTAPIEVSMGLVNEILANLPGRVKTIENPANVVRWQESNPDWPNLSLVEIARTFHADTVLYVELERYTMYEERSANLYRGHVRARIQVAEAAAEHNPVYETTIETLYPPDQPVSVLGTSERILRAVTNAEFSRQVIGKFYDHEVEVQGGRP